MTPITIIIPHWNRRDLLATILPRLASQTHPISEVLVVDNGSSDDSAEWAEAAGARVIRIGFNSGFATAVNRGIQECRTDWLAVVNNDVEPEPGWLGELVTSAKRAEAWFATGKIYTAGQPDVIDGTFDAICRGACAWRCGNGRKDGPAWSAASAIRFPPFTATLFRKELFDRVGGLDETFESYLEDVDFGLRCALSAHPGVYVPRAIAYHRGSATLGRWNAETVRRIARNQLLLVAKHYPGDWPLRYGWPILVAQLLWGVVAARHGTATAYLRGKWEGIRQFPQMRGNSGADVGRILEESERELRHLQQQTGFDWYWRVYFGLT